MEQNTTALLKEQIAPYFDDEDFCTELFKAENPAQLVQLLSRYGIEATEDEVSEISNEGSLALAAMKDSPCVELNENELDEVAGGGKWRRVLRGAVSVVGGAALGAGLGFMCGVCPAFTPAAYTIAHVCAAGAVAWIISG